MSVNAELCFILCFPDKVEAASEPPGQIRDLKDAPYFQPVDVSVSKLEQTEVLAGGERVKVFRQRYDNRIQVLECRFQLPDVLEKAAAQQRARIEKELLKVLVPARHLDSGMFEEYMVLVPQGVTGTEKFIQTHARALAHFIRPQREAFDAGEVDEILASRVRYSKDDLTLVDWGGAVIIAPKGDFQSDIELLKIGNYQLLRYRLLDQNIENSLRTIAGQFRVGTRRSLRPGPTRRQIRQIVGSRLELMLDFEHTEQNLLLIGDWYTAKLYQVIRSELYLNNWKDAVHDKLDNLESIIGTIRENFSLSWSELLGQVELAGWLILLIGYFILFFMESGIVK
jgi:hypothetical protein